MKDEMGLLLDRSRRLATKSSYALLLTTLVGAGALACSGAAPLDDEEVVGETSQQLKTQLPNNRDFKNEGGHAATFSTAGFIDLANAFHTPQGTNGRSCGTCHLPESGWGINPSKIECLFAETDGTAPIFNPLDANSATADVSTPEARYASYSMLRKGLFRRGANRPLTAEYNITAVDDPLGAGGTTTTGNTTATTGRFEFFRRPLATANFHLALNVGWHSQNGTSTTPPPTAGLTAQATGNITGAQQGPAPTAETVASIVTYESQLSFAQTRVPGAGHLDQCGAQGGPEILSGQALVNGPFTLFDAWASGSGCAHNPHRRQIARGQALFNAVNAGGGSCRGCHNAANNGSNVNGTLFDIGASDADVREPGMPLYTLTQIAAPFATKQTTDPGRAGAGTGTWASINRFKVPSLRGLAARAPYFHNGIAKNLHDVVEHYEQKLGFVFTPSEEEDLVAFMNAL